mgnify:CR=1 FL=1
MSTPPESTGRLFFGAALITAIVGARLLWEPGLLGSPAGEIWGHAWVQWWHALALPSWPEGPGAWLVSPRPWPVVDPLPTALAAGLGRLLGPTAGYNLWVLLAVFIAFVGGARLARRLGGDPWVGGVALALAPSLLGAAASGLTEDLAVGLAALTFADLGHRDPWRGARAGVWLALLCTCGLVLGWATGLIALGLGLAFVRQDRLRLKGLVPAGLLAVAAAAALGSLHGGRLGGHGHRLGTAMERTEPLWRLNPTRGVDVLSYVVPGRVDPGDALVRMHPGYLGLSLLGLACFAGRSRWWWVLGAVLLVAPGHHLAAAGSPLGVQNPFAAGLGLLPFGELVNHHGRLLLLGAVALSALAAVGATRRLGARAPWMAIVVGLDLALLGPVPTPLPTAPPSGQALLSSLGELPDGPLLQLPAGGPGVHPQLPLFQQRFHQRPLVKDPNVPGLPLNLRDSPLGPWLGSIGHPGGPPPPETVLWPDEVAVIVVWEPWVSTVVAGLGPPAVQGPEGAAWIAP